MPPTRSASPAPLWRESSPCLSSIISAQRALRPTPGMSSGLSSSSPGSNHVLSSHPQAQTMRGPVPLQFTAAGSPTSTAGPGAPRRKLYSIPRKEAYQSQTGLRSELEGAESLVCFSPQTKRMKVKDQHSSPSAFRTLPLLSAWKTATRRVFTQVCFLFYFCSKLGTLLKLETLANSEEDCKL